MKNAPEHFGLLATRRTEQRRASFRSFADNVKRAALLFSAFCLLLFPLAVCAQTAAMPARVETVQFESRLIGARLPYNVVLPPDYAQPQSHATRYPVLYLLHGLTGDYSNWTARTRLAEYAAQYRLIIITPEGHNSWYTDSPMVETDRYETYLLRELMPDVERRYRTIQARAGRAVAGLSMGGYGALKLGLKYPEMFAFAASLSGAFDAPLWDNDSELQSVSEVSRRSRWQAFGPAGHPAHAANDLFHLTRQLPASQVGALPFFYFDCGTEDPFLPVNRRLAELFAARRIRHEYRQLPGGHTWAYWDAQVREVLRQSAQRLAPARRARTGP